MSLTGFGREIPAKTFRELVHETERLRKRAAQIEHFRLQIRLQIRPEYRWPVIGFWKNERTPLVLTEVETTAFYEWLNEYHAKLISEAIAKETIIDSPITETETSS